MYVDGGLIVYNEEIRGNFRMAQRSFEQSQESMAVFLSNTRGYSVLVVGDDDLARKLVHVLGVGRPSGGLPCSRSCRLGQRATHPEPT